LKLSGFYTRGQQLDVDNVRFERRRPRGDTPLWAAGSASGIRRGRHHARYADLAELWAPGGDPLPGADNPRLEILQAARR